MIKSFQNNKTSVRKSMELKQSCGMQMPLAIDKNRVVDQNTSCAGGDKLGNGSHREKACTAQRRALGVIFSQPLEKILNDPGVGSLWVFHLSRISRMRASPTSPRIAKNCLRSAMRGATLQKPLRLYHHHASS